MTHLQGELIGGIAPAVRFGEATLPLNGYKFRDPACGGCDLVIGIRPEHIGLATQAQEQCAVDADTLFMEPMGADTLGWFQCGAHRIAARLIATGCTPDQRHRAIELRDGSGLVVRSGQ